jgi:hypothetical protein
MADSNRVASDDGYHQRAPRDIRRNFVRRTDMVSAKSSADTEGSPDLQVIIDDIAALKRDLATLIRGLKSDAAGGVAGAKSAVEQLGDEALQVYENLAAQGERSLKAIGRQVEEQPAISLLVAFALGFIGSRILSR